MHMHIFLTVFVGVIALIEFSLFCKLDVLKQLVQVTRKPIYLSCIKHVL
jgi:hypothetical protein